MSEEIYLEDIECPYCDRDTYMESWSIKVDQYKKVETTLTCDVCGGSFKVRTEVTVDIIKE